MINNNLYIEMENDNNFLSAAKGGDISYIKENIRYISPNIKKEAILSALENSMTNIADFIIKNQNYNRSNEKDLFNKAFTKSVHFGKLKSVNYLLNSKEGYLTKEEQNDMLIEAASVNNLEMFKFLASSGFEIEDITILNIFSCYGNIEGMKFILERGIDLSDKTNLIMSSFTYAIQRNDKETIDILMQYGADIHIDNDDIFYNAYSKGGGCEMIEHLIEKGADITSKNYGVVRFSASLGNIETIKSLVINHGIEASRVLENISVHKDVKDWIYQYQKSVEMKQELENTLEDKKYNVRIKL